MANFQKSTAPFRRLNQRKVTDEKIEFRAVLGNGININMYGEVVFSVTVPMDSVEDHGSDILKLRRMVGLPLTMTVQIWDEFDDYLRDHNGDDDGGDTSDDGDRDDQ